MIYLKNLISLFLLIFSFNSYATIEESKTQEIEKFLYSYGYEVKNIEFNSEYIKNTYKFYLKIYNESLVGLRPKSELFIFNKNDNQGFLVYDIDDNKKQNSFKRMSTSLSYFKKTNARFLRSSLPIKKIIKSKFKNTEIFNSTTHSFLLPFYNNNVLMGELIDFKENQFINLTKELILLKKEQENNTIKSLINKYPDLLLSSKIIDEEKVIVVLFSESCGYCKKMINNYKKYNEKGYSLLILPAVEISYDIKFRQNTYKYFCSLNISESLINKTYNENCNLENNKLNDIYKYKNQLLRGIQFKGTPTLYLTEYSLWYSGYLDANSF